MVYQKVDKRFGSPLFGTNYGVLKTGNLAVGDTVSIV